MGIGTSIKAGNPQAPNKFSDECSATLDVRTIPEMHDRVLADIKNWLKDFPVKVSLCYPPAPFGLIDKNEEIVKVLLALKSGLKVMVSSGSTDQCWFTQAKIPAIIFGPGEEDQAHQSNEWCYPKKIFQAVKIYSALIPKWGKMNI